MILNTFIYNNYDSNPLVAMCLAKQPRKIWYLEDLLPYINKLKHAKWCYEHKKWNFLCDELRLYLASISDDFVYVDADCLVRNPECIKMDYCAPGTNDGTFFRANKNTEWVKYYLNIYETEEIKDTINYVVHKRYPFEIPIQDDIEYKHYFLSFWSRYNNRIKSRPSKVIFDAEHETDVKCYCRKDYDEYHYYRNLDFDI